MSTKIWESVTWAVARTGGITAYLLLALAVIVGLMLSLQWQSPARWPRLINSEMHNFLTLLATVFVGVHVLAVWIDPFTRFGWNEVFIPFVSHYRTSGMVFGIVALYLSIAIGISTWLRSKIGYTWWRRFHVLTLVVFVFTTLHGIITGTDNTSLWMIGMYSVCSVLIGTLFVLRLRKSAAQKNKRRAVSASHARQVVGTRMR